MRLVSVTGRISAARETVYPLIADLAVRPAFTDHFMREMRLQRIDSADIGATVRCRLDAPRATIWMETVITEAEPPFRVVERGKGGRLDRIPIYNSWELVPVSGDSTEVTVTFAIEPVALADRIRYALVGAGWYRRQFKRALGRLREIAETGVEPQRIAVGGQSRIAA
jgi:hypothetical protein